LASHDAVDTDILCYSLYLVAEDREPVNHVIDSLLEDEDFSLGLNVDLATHITVGNSLCDR